MIVSTDIPHIKLPGSRHAPCSTRAMVVSIKNAVNHPIKLTKPSDRVVNWRSVGSGGDFHYFALPSISSKHLSLGYLIFTSDDL